ncbi:hypothetical protein HYDPIDRAFT_94224 [Hydnomerulius pinastri MD-312]|uniref:Uncharacterized protein n=1 Tax=Hydnomerulius pinastri MD-312 TaxID=994086 RepID=A0A0C9W6M3_9AGAM|nr:hypothetical protein HYDPIDRAFT_94224 [Hydnomerulius pinastri MD-312]
MIPRIVHDCPITNPNTRTIWKAGARATVFWDTSGIPVNTTSTGKIMLGYLEPNDTSEHLDTEHPMAEGFKIAEGHVSVTVPRVPPKKDYIAVLFGDSGNRSPVFTIEN